MTDAGATPSTIAANRVFLDGSFAPATVHFARGVITKITPLDAAADRVLADDEVLLPGLVDSHVHLNEPGRTDWEGFASGTAAALAGGVTTVVEMPLNSIPVTTTPAALAVKRAAAQGQLATDLAYWGGAVPENLGSLGELLVAGVVGVKCFMAPSGIEEFGHLERDELERALAELAEVDGLLIAHAELAEFLTDASGPVFRDFVASRPPAAEIEAIRVVIEAARRTGARAHIVHVAAGGAVDLLRAAQRDGVRITAETCPHYLTLRAEDVPDGLGRFKCCPPIRGGDDQGLLWDGVLDGTISAIVSDHSPATAALKDNPDLGAAWGGIAGAQTALSTLWTEARRREISLEQLVPLLTTGPASVAGLTGRGLIEIGAPAHFAVFAPDERYTLQVDDLQYRNRMSPWEGKLLSGRVRETILHGTRAWTVRGGLLARHGREIIAGAA